MITNVKNTVRSESELQDVITNHRVTIGVRTDCYITNLMPFLN